MWARECVRGSHQWMKCKQYFVCSRMSSLHTRTPTNTSLEYTQHNVMIIICWIISSFYSCAIGRRRWQLVAPFFLVFYAIFFLLFSVQASFSAVYCIRSCCRTKRVQCQPDMRCGLYKNTTNVDKVSLVCCEFGCKRSQNPFWVCVCALRVW